MKQILLVTASTHFPKGPLAFLQAMQPREKIHARGLFFEPIDFTALSKATRTTYNLTPLIELEKTEKAIVASQKASFAQACEQSKIPYTIHDNDQGWDKDLLIRESKFADLILISDELFYAEAWEKQPNLYLREILHNAQCPVLAIPESFTHIEQLFIAYDGSLESLYALKQFCYLFPAFTDLPAELVYCKKESGDAIPEIDALEQYIRLKLPFTRYSKLHFKASSYFPTWISEKKDALLISGSFGRSSISNATRHSFAEELIREHKLPIFIAHK
ncbi:MAG TPA: hypothetical protein VL832_05080 [Puia sp.]|jgi:hypothetical protein|nr:hypothetical protein [Puia sp.]